jgi:hypothetical protein
MDSYSEHPRDFDLPASPAEPTSTADVTIAIGTDERRMHVRAYNYWVQLLEGRDFPSIEDLEPSDVLDFASNSVLLDFTCGRDNPAVPYIGEAIREECGLDEATRTISDVPSRSLLSRLTDHYLQIIANRAPIGFEAEFVNQRSENICYRGILMPFSSSPRRTARRRKAMPPWPPPGPPASRRARPPRSPRLVPRLRLPSPPTARPSPPATRRPGPPRWSTCPSPRRSLSRKRRLRRLASTTMRRSISLRRRPRNI